MATLSTTAIVPARAADVAERGQSAASARREAKAEYTRGRKLLDEKRYAEALAAFRAAHALAPSVSAQEQIAYVLLATGDLARAHGAYSELLKRHGDELDKQRRGRAQRALRELDATTGAVEIAIAEPGAEVQVDGVSVGSTPLAASLRLVRGAHVVRVTKAGFKPLSVELSVDSEQVRVEKTLELEPAVAHATITSSGGLPAALFVDGQRVGSLPWQGEIAAGNHVIQARSKDHASTEHRIQVEKGAALNLSLELSPLPATLRAFGGHPTAVIAIDGNVVGHGSWEGTVAPGPHQVEVRRLGFQPRTEVIRAEPGGVIVLPEPELQPVSAVAAPVASSASSGSPMADRGTEASSSDDQLERYRGVYAQLALAGLFSKRATNEIAADCPAEEAGGGCESMAPVGGAAAVRIGYNFGWLGIEGLALASGDVSRTTAEYNRGASPAQSEFYGVARNEDYTFFRYGWGGGVAVRASSPTGTLRLTGSLGGGFMQRSARYLRVAVSREKLPGTGVPSGAKHLESEVATYVAPVLIADVGLTIGSSPGARFYLGGMLLVEAGQGQASVAGKEQRLGFNSTGGESAYGTPSVDITRGPVVQFGPVLGVMFGG